MSSRWERIASPDCDISPDEPPSSGPLVARRRNEDRKVGSDVTGPGLAEFSAERGARHVSGLKNEKELLKQPTAEHFHTAARLRELAAEATTPWVKQHLRSLIEECERMAGEYKETDPA
jgi:hypothetical protein